MAAPPSPSPFGLVIPAEASLLHNQAILEPAKTSHHLSAADDLVGRFQLEESYYVLLHPFRKDLPRSGTSGRRISSGGDAEESKGQGERNQQTHPTSVRKEETTAPSSTAINLARTYEHFLPPFLPGRIRPMKPPRKRQTINRRQALQNIAELQQQQGSGGEVQIKSRDRELAKKDEEWERFKQTLRRVVYKPEYTPADIRPLEDDAMKGFRVQAGEVEEIDRSLLEADPPPGSIQPKKKKRKIPGGGSTPAAGSPRNAPAPST